MRTVLLSALLGVSLLGCVSTIGDGEELIDTDGDGTPDTPAPDEDDVDPTLPAKVTATADNPTVATELGTTSMLTFNVGAENFTGPVTLAATVTDGAGAALTGWTVSLATTTLTMVPGANNPVVATLTIPTEFASGGAPSIAANVKFDVTTGTELGVVTTTSAITALNQVSVEVKENAANGDCILPGPTPVQVKVGTKIRIVNKFANDNIVIHSDNGNVIPHEGNNGTGPNAAYENTPTQAGTVPWYCHAPASGNNANKPRFVIVE